MARILLGNHWSSGKAVEEPDQQSHLEGEIQRSSGVPRPDQITCRGRKLIPISINEYQYQYRCLPTDQVIQCPLDDTVRFFSNQAYLDAMRKSLMKYI